jgi:hypothetical protein
MAKTIIVFHGYSSGSHCPDGIISAWIANRASISKWGEGREIQIKQQEPHAIISDLA